MVRMRSNLSSKSPEVYKEDVSGEFEYRVDQIVFLTGRTR